MATRLKHEEDEKVQQVRERLQKIITELKDFARQNHIFGYQVHPRVREEIARLYDEHGGIEMISKLTKISYKTIKEWRVKYKRNPLFFQEMPLHPPFYRPLPQAQYKAEELSLAERLNACETFKDAKTVEEVRTLLSDDICAEVDLLKQQVNAAMETAHELSPPLKLRIVKLVLRAGSARPIALVLGLNQKVIMSWKGLLSLAEKEVIESKES